MPRIPSRGFVFRFSTSVIVLRDTVRRPVSKNFHITSRL